MPKTDHYRDTTVSVERTKAQIEDLLRENGVDTIRFTSFPAMAILEFIHAVEGRAIPYRISLKPQPDPNTRSLSRAQDRAERQVWRACYWWLKSKFDAIAFGLVEMEREFLPYMLVADGQGQTTTVAEVLAQRLEGRTVLPGDPFGGLAIALPPGRG